MTTLRLAESDLFSRGGAGRRRVDGLAAGIALDLWHSAGLCRLRRRTIGGSDDLADIAGADYIVMTAGKPRQPGMSRTDLTAANAAIVGPVATGSPHGTGRRSLVVVTNPLEEMTHLAGLRTGFPAGAGARHGRRARLGPVLLAGRR